MQLYDNTGKIVLHYNQACCYQRLGMMNECVDALKRAIEVIEGIYSKVCEDYLQTQTLNSISAFNPSKKKGMGSGSSFATSGGYREVSKQE